MRNAILLWVYEPVVLFPYIKFDPQPDDFKAAGK